MSSYYGQVEIYDDDLNVTEKWLVKVSIIKEEIIEEPAGKYMKQTEYIKRTWVYELIQRFAPEQEMVLGYEVSKLPVLYLPEKEKTVLERIGDLRIYTKETADSHYLSLDGKRWPYSIAKS